MEAYIFDVIESYKDIQALTSRSARLKSRRSAPTTPRNNNTANVTAAPVDTSAHAHGHVTPLPPTVRRLATHPSAWSHTDRRLFTRRRSSESNHWEMISRGLHSHQVPNSLSPSHTHSREERGSDNLRKLAPPRVHGCFDDDTTSCETNSDPGSFEPQILDPVEFEPSHAHTHASTPRRRASSPSFSRLRNTVFARNLFRDNHVPTHKAQSISLSRSRSVSLRKRSKRYRRLSLPRNSSKSFRSSTVGRRFLDRFHRKDRDTTSSSSTERRVERKGNSTFCDTRWRGVPHLKSYERCLRCVAFVVLTYTHMIITAHTVSRFAVFSTSCGMYFQPHTTVLIPTRNNGVSKTLLTNKSSLGF